MKEVSKISTRTYIIRSIIIFLIFLVILELTANLAGQLYRGELGTKFFSDNKVNMYNNETYGKIILIENKLSEKMMYEPYVDYKKIPKLNLTTIHLNENSQRVTINPCVNESSIKIFIFGGSTVWGEGVEDYETFPSHLSKYLCEKGYSVNVTNFGESAYANTQEMIKLILEIKKGNKPNIVIFFDGDNEVLASYNNQVAGYPHNYIGRLNDYGARNKINLRNIITNSNIVKVLIRIMNVQPVEKDFNETLINETAQVYYDNIVFINNIEEEHSFKGFYYWQPTIYDKNMVSIKESDNIDRSQKFKEIHRELKNKVYEMDNDKIIIFKNNVFKNNSHTLFIDTYHVFSEGNRIIAENVGGDIEEWLQKQEE